MHSEMEALWIERVRDNEDSMALDELVKRYQPMIENMQSQYFVTGFDRDDWYQEALIVCYQTCKLFDGTTGSKFGSFYKMKFKHRMIDLIRRENAAKRKINSLTEPLEVSDQTQLTIPSHKLLVELSDHIERVASEMNQMELVGLKFVLGHLSIEEACRQAKCDSKKMRRIITNCKKKLWGFDDLELS